MANQEVESTIASTMFIVQYMLSDATWHEIEKCENESAGRTRLSHVKKRNPRDICRLIRRDTTETRIQ